MHQLSSELEEYLGNVGMHVYMRGIWESGSRCWDWSTLALRPPRQMHAEAFVKLYNALQPSLQHTLWPDSARLLHVE